MKLKHRNKVYIDTLQTSISILITILMIDFFNLYTYYETKDTYINLIFILLIYTILYLLLGYLFDNFKKK